MPCRWWGVYSLRASLVDCAVAAAFGMLDFILRRLELPLVPIVLGVESDRSVRYQ